MDKEDVTKLVDFNNNDDEFLPITGCVCGNRFPAWEFIISIYNDESIHQCPKCGVKLFFRNEIRVYKVS